jgi:hypothetical protein
MTLSRTRLLLFCSALLLPYCASAQYHLKWVFNGIRYQTNSSGDLVGTPITDQTILQEVCQQCGVNPANMAILYHFGADSRGDVVNIFNTNAYPYPTKIFYPYQLNTNADLYAFFFGQDASLDRTGVTNSSNTEVRVTDYIYTDQGNGHSVGASFTTKRFLKDQNNNLKIVIDGQVEWVELPRLNIGTPLRMYKGAFSVGPPVF